jgi:MYXO-CTERM domain-containing protein
MMNHSMPLRFAAATSLLAVALWSPKSAHAIDCDSNLMIVLDRSCSMNKTPDGATETKWESAVAAIENLTVNYAGQLRLGLIMFPDETGERCEQDGAIYVNAGPDHEDEVMAAIEGTLPDGPCVTNIDTALAQVWDDPAYDPAPVEPPTRRSFVVLVTDGAQSSACGGVDRDPVTEQIILDLYAANFPTYVVGFGGKVRAASLELFAVSGGVPRVGDPVYYQADTAEDLDEVLDVIAGSVVGDPEFGGCQGLPCPDNWCPGEYDECVDNVCLSFFPDGGPADANTGGDGDGGFTDLDAGVGGSATNGVSGCGCHTGSTPRGEAFGSMLLMLAALWLSQGRRKRS